jgi:Uri superfamily endonuclease
MARLDGRPGTYALLLKAGATRSIEVGRLGVLELTPGFFVYVGSAFGGGGLGARTSRHCSSPKTLHWHVDYLRAATEPFAIWYTLDAVPRECQWSNVLSHMSSTAFPLRGFGSSDCTCKSHLHFFCQQPSPASFRRRLRRVIPDHGPVHTKMK